MNAIGVLVAAIVLAASILAGCGGSGDSTDASRPELVVFGAASLGPAFEKYGDDFDGADVRFSFAGSDDLAAQIRQGVKPEGDNIMGDLTDAGRKFTSPLREGDPGTIRIPKS